MAHPSPKSLVSEDNDITVIDKIRKHLAAQARFDLRGIVGNALSPAPNRSIYNDTDLLIAVTSSDETNLAATLLADKSIFQLVLHE